MKILNYLVAVSVGLGTLSGCAATDKVLEQAINKQVDAMHAATQKEFQGMLSATKDDPALHRRIKALSNEWETAKGDSQKLAVVEKKLNDLIRDMEKSTAELNQKPKP